MNWKRGDIAGAILGRRGDLISCVRTVVVNGTAVGKYILVSPLGAVLVSSLLTPTQAKVALGVYRMAKRRKFLDNVKGVVTRAPHVLRQPDMLIKYARTLANMYAVHEGTTERWLRRVMKEAGYVWTGTEFKKQEEKP